MLAAARQPERVAARARRAVEIARVVAGAVLRRLGRALGAVAAAVLYLTVFAPFGLLCRATRSGAGWRPARKD